MYTINGAPEIPGRATAEILAPPTLTAVLNAGLHAHRPAGPQRDALLVVAVECGRVIVTQDRAGKLTVHGLKQPLFHYN